MGFSGTAGFIGVGKMGGILAEGAIGAELLSRDQVLIYDADAVRASELSAALGVAAAPSVEKVVEVSDMVFIGVKPDQFPGISGAVKSAWSARKPALVSIMAGVRVERIKKLLGTDAPVIRVMPNVACLIRQGVAGVAVDPAASGDINRFVIDLFEALGGAVVVAEGKLDAVTALSGSGPAYVFMFIEALADAGVKFGLDRASALRLAVRTVAGAALMVERTGDSTLDLRARVSSPGGTTVAATSKLESSGFRGAVIEAVEAAYKRSLELAG
jgi:pyrroline-5-carboxylate reductase